MMLGERMTQTFNALDPNSKRNYVNQPNASLMSSRKSSFNSSTRKAIEWHHLLLAHFKPGVTGKYTITKKDSNKTDLLSSIYFEETPVILQAYNDESFSINQCLPNHPQSTQSKEPNSTIESSARRENHYVKKSLSNRPDDHITSLKRRVRKQQFRCLQNQATIVQDATLPLPPSTNILLKNTYPEQAESSPRRYRQKKSTCLVSLPPLINVKPATTIHSHEPKFNLYGY